MPLPPEILEELERKRREEHQQAQRDAFWANVRTALLCVGWSAAGLGVMAFGLHTTDPEIGGIAWKGGMVLGYAGIVFTLARWHSKAKDRGDI